jgi:hypothetical protein
VNRCEIKIFLTFTTSSFSSNGFDEKNSASPQTSSLSAKQDARATAQLTVKQDAGATAQSLRSKMHALRYCTTKLKKKLRIQGRKSPFQNSLNDCRKV